MRPRPPRLAQFLATISSPAGPSRDGLLGDLCEGYSERCESKGWLRAYLWYWYQALFAALRYVTERTGNRFAGRRDSRANHGRRDRTRQVAPRLVETMLQDVRYTLRLLRKAPAFTLVAALTIALGIAATTTIFSVVNAVLLRPPPGVRHAGEIVRLHRIDEDGESYNDFSYPAYRDYRDGPNGMVELAGTALTFVIIGAETDPESAIGFLVTHNFFDVLGVRPALGRFFLPEEDETPGAQPVVILSHGTWSRLFGADSSVIGRTVALNRNSFTVIGVTERGFRGPVSVLPIGIWLPMSATRVLNPQFDLSSRTSTWVEPIGRRAAGVSLAQVSEAVNLISDNLRVAHSEDELEYGVDVQPYGPIGRRAFLAAAAFAGFLFVVSGTVLLIACINVGSMLLSRASQRGREVALRMAIGAGRARVVRQLLTESVVLFTFGAIGGILITVYATRLLSAFQLPIDVPITLDFSPDARVLVFTLLVALASGIVFGLAPALQTTKPDLNTTLKIGSTGGGSRLRGVFVVAQVTGSALLLVIAGLFARSLTLAHTVDLGFEPRNVQMMGTELDFHGGYTAEEAAVFYGNVLERVSELPQVESAGLIDWPPVTLGGQSTRYAVVGGEPVDEEDWDETDYAVVTPGYFGTLRIPIVQGRNFSGGDDAGTVMVVIVNQTLARRMWPGESPLGKRIQLRSSEEPQLEVVGVARDAKYRSLSEEPLTMVYIPYAQRPTANMVLFARYRDEQAAVTTSIRDIVSDLEPGLPVDANAPYEDIMGIALLPNRAAAIMTTIFGALGLLLASLGLYGVLAYTVSRRTREFGVRMALGARVGDIRAQVVRDGVKLVAIGLAIGLALALPVSFEVRYLLYGISPTDPIAFVGTALLLLAVAIAASYLPARRATRVSPVDALRSE